MFFPRFVFASIFIASCLTTFTLGATLANDEVEALKIIGRTLGKTWNFGIDPCSGDQSWLETEQSDYYANNVTCDCSFNNSNTCHVVRILLKAQNLSGTLPRELVNLPFLQGIDLTRNYLSGPIPPEWGSMQLVTIDLLGNRLTGSIPEELANLSNLTGLVLEHNSFSGNLPGALGNLPKIERMFLNSNNFTGELPETFANLTTLKEFRISDNNFTGTIPEFIFRNWTKLEQIYIEGNGLSGPIPNIDSLENAKYIIISDLNGDEASFPQLSNLTKVERLMLRSCNLIGELPDSLGDLTTLKTLSFWAFSSTGIFTGDNRDDDILILENTQLSATGDALYTTARRSPSSLTYYAFCLKNTTYRVSLHFAEIQFTDGQNYSSLGRRIFDVYIQGKRELENFNIMEEAGGAGKPIVKFFNVTVTDGTLEIQLRWAGKGTTSIPTRGIHGPLISAISVVDPDYTPPSESDGGITTAAVVGIVGGALFATLLIGGTL